MVKAKKGKVAKVKSEAAPAKMSKDMKASVEKMVAKVQDWASKKFAAIEKQLEKAKGGQAKQKAGGKATKKSKPMKAGKKKGKTSKKKSNSENQAETAE